MLIGLLLLAIALRLIAANASLPIGLSRDRPGLPRSDANAEKRVTDA
ncbi:hypothetical protein AB0B45_00265 [Nonomuraea sp. NPDC049152]